MTTPRGKRFLKAFLIALSAVASLMLLLAAWLGTRILWHDHTPVERFYAGPSAKQPRPIVLVHGLNRTGRIWTIPDDGHGNRIPNTTGMADFLQANGYPNLYVNTFADTRNTSLLENAKALKKWIARAKLRFRSNGVDLIAHSMGALAARAYLQEMDRAEDRDAEPVRYGEDVVRLIMISAPHLGSPLADTLSTLVDRYATRTLKAGGGTDLRHLNARCLPPGVGLHSIIVSTSPNRAAQRSIPRRILRFLFSQSRPSDGDGVLSLRSQNLETALKANDCPPLRHSARVVRAEPGIGHRDVVHSPVVQRAVLQILNGG